MLAKMWRNGYTGNILGGKAGITFLKSRLAVIKTLNVVTLGPSSTLTTIIPGKIML